MTEVNIGDFVISENEIYEITGKTKEDSNIWYSVKLLDNPANSLDFAIDQEHSLNGSYDEVTSLARSCKYTLETLKYIGHVVKKEDASKAIEILFKKR